MTFEPYIAAMLIAASLAGAGDLSHTDLKLLRDEETRQAEIERLVCGDSEHEKLTGYHLFDCPQAGDAPPLTVLLASSDYDFGSGPGLDEYPLERPWELFGDDHREVVAGLGIPGRMRLDGMLLMVFDTDGKERRLFGGDNMISDGYVRDVNGDGIVERIDTSNYGVRDGFTVTGLEVITFERQARRLLQVVYNWHPDESDGLHEWSFACVDQDGADTCLIAFGPEIGGAVQREVVFGWDADLSEFRPMKGADHPHIKVLDDSDPWPQLKQLDRDGGLSYALGPAGPGSAGNIPATSDPYRHRSLAGLSNEELEKFMGGRPTPDHFYDSEAPHTGAPDGLCAMNPKDAALALADANRTVSHRRNHPLAVDDRGGIAPPKAGWLLWDFTSSGCYTLRGHMMALRFGTDSPVLIHASISHNGAVSRNQLADRTGHMLRFIELDFDTARFFADVVFWLDRIRSAPNKDNGHGSHMSSTADGFGTLHRIVDGEKPVEIASTTIWADRSIANRWDGAYNRETFLNLVSFLLDEVLPGQLGDRWNAMPPIEHRNLATPLEERLKPREDSDIRDHLVASMATVLAFHEEDSVPVPMLAHIVPAAGEVGLVPLLPELEKLAGQLAEPDERELEFRKLDEKVDRRLMQPPKPLLEEEDPAERREWDRHQELKEWYDFDFSARLREPLSTTLRKLRTVEQPDELAKWAESDEPGCVWALQQLQLHWPDDYARVLIDRLPDAGTGGQKMIFSTLAAAHPPGAKLLRSQLTEAQQNNLAIELVQFEIEDEPDLAASRIPALLAIVEDVGGTRNWSERNPALRLLSRLPLDKEAGEHLEELLLAELTEPRRDDVKMSSLGAVIDTLVARPDPDRFWDPLAACVGKATDYSEFGSLVEALATLAVARPDPRRAQLEEFLRPRFHRHKGLMNDLFLTALALDLKGLRQEIGPLATAEADVPDGEGAHSWGGNFEKPDEERYHRARHVVALWDEPDPATRARMWCLLIASVPHEFAPGQSTIGSELCRRVEAALKQVPPAVRDACLKRVLNDQDVARYEKTHQWLAGLGGGD